MNDRDIFIIPEAPALQRTIAAPLARPVGSTVRIGVLDNSKGNADHLLSLLVDGLRDVLPAGSAIASRRKHSAAEAAHPQLLDGLAAEADVIISAMAD